MVALGCAKNMVDAEIMLGALVKDGIEITNDPALADAVIVNTCSFINDAQEESVDAILESDALRAARHHDQALIVSGCLPQRFQKDLPGLMPEVDAFMGIDQVAQISGIVRQAVARRETRRANPRSVALAAQERRGLRPAANRNGPGAGESARRRTPKRPQAQSPPLVAIHPRPSFIPDYATPRFRLTPRHFAYVKIAEGCNHPCSFCIIPRIRGSHRSRPLPDVVHEARQLLAEGVRELNLISQDSTYYGLDLRPGRTGSIAAPERFGAAARALPANAPSLSNLLRELNALPGDFWIRVLYTHPAHWTDELIQTIAQCPKVARYADIPLQHIQENMLARMRRETSKNYIVDLLHHIRAGIPGIALRTTFIVGFPGETEGAFEALLDFIRETKFERLGVFTYSQEEGTVAGRMTLQVPDKVKQQRRQLAMAEQHKVAEQVAASFVGRTLKVLVEGRASDRDLKAAHVFSWEHGLIREPAPGGPRLRAGEYLVARSQADAPDIDGRVYLRGSQRLGDFTQAKVIGHTDYDLIAEPL
jgi:ribosomal protein S12 methylthiotransferase